MARQTLTLGLVVTLVVLALSTCGGGGSGGERAEQKKAPEGTFELPNGRSLYMECRGSGSPPTVVFEVGDGEPRSDTALLQGTLAHHYMTCTYNRANTGKSSKAPTPRTAGQIVSDLHELLKTADVPGPYVLEGTSAGGSYVQLYGRRYPDEVVGVVAMNPVPPADAWMDRALPRFNKQERQADRAYYRGDNFEHIDWFTSYEELKKAPAPPPVPFEMIISTKVQCEGEPPPCIMHQELRRIRTDRV